MKLSKQFLVLSVILGIFINPCFAEGRYYPESDYIYDLATYRTCGMDNYYTSGLRCIYPYVSIDLYYDITAGGDADTPIVDNKGVVYIILNVKLEKHEGEGFIPIIKYKGFVTGVWAFKDDYAIFKIAKIYNNKNNLTDIKKYIEDFSVSSGDGIENFRYLKNDLTNKFLYAKERNMLFQFKEARSNL